MWALFRVENEHCANVSQYKASRDVPLPYRIEPLMDRATPDTSPDIPPQGQEQQTDASQQQESAQEEGRVHPTTAFPRAQGGFSTSSSTAVASTLGTLRKRADTSSARTFSKILADAHRQDFEKKRKGKDVDDEDQVERGHSDDDDDDDDDDEGDEEDGRDGRGSEEEAIERHQAARLRRRGEDIVEEEEV